jgi:hypothetical protein
MQGSSPAPHQPARTARGIFSKTQKKPASLSASGDGRRGMVADYAGISAPLRSRRSWARP